MINDNEVHKFNEKRFKNVNDLIKRNDTPQFIMENN